MVSERLRLLPHSRDAEIPGFAILVVDRQVECEPGDASEPRMLLGLRSDSRGRVDLRHDGSEALRRLSSVASAVVAERRCKGYHILVAGPGRMSDRTFLTVQVEELLEAELVVYHIAVHARLDDWCHVVAAGGHAASRP